MSYTSSHFDPSWLSLYIASRYNVNRMVCTEPTHMAIHRMKTKFITRYWMRKCSTHFPPVHAASLATFITYSFKIEQIMRGKFLGILFTIGTNE